jgi:Fur family peroxide stress response transcriptional regulator
MTPQRRAIVEYLARAAGHPTADDVYRAVNKRFPMTSRATVYNTLRMLKEAGLVGEMQEGAAVRYDPNLSAHHHFVCTSCGAVQDFEFDSAGIRAAVMLKGAPRVDSCQMTLRGLCARCLEETE